MKADIRGHDVSWWVEDKSITELDEISLQHIDDKIGMGYVEGELHVKRKVIQRINDGSTSRGWWNIIDWKNIALQLYVALHDNVDPSSHSEKQKEAMKLFNENW